MAVSGSWTAWPERPRRYRLRDRWSDLRNGRADARKSIPGVTSDQAGIVRETPAADAALTWEPGRPEDVTADPVENANLPLTPYLAGLRHSCGKDLAGVEEAWFGLASPQFLEKLREVETRYEPLAIARDLAATRMDKVSGELTNEELNRRGVAEQNEKKWPAEMVRERRRRERRRAQLEAEEALYQATTELREAEVAVKHARRARSEAFKAAQAVGFQIFHHYRRREATYLRVLARKHKSGPELVKLLELTSPELPGWLLLTNSEDDSKEGPDAGIGREPTGP